MKMCLYLFDLTHFSGQGRNPSNNFVALLENLRHRNFVLRLSDLYIYNSFQKSSYKLINNSALQTQGFVLNRIIDNAFVEVRILNSHHTLHLFSPEASDYLGRWNRGLRGEEGARILLPPPPLEGSKLKYLFIAKSWCST